MSLLFCEKWRDIDLSEEKSFVRNDLKGLYQVSNTGKIKKVGGNHVKTYKDKQGYLAVCVKGRSGTSYRATVHMLVANAFLKNPNKKKFNTINHKDENKMNADVRNLEWCTTKYNVQYSAYRKRKLTDDDILTIYKWQYCIEKNEIIKESFNTMLTARKELKNDLKIEFKKMRVDFVDYNLDELDYKILECIFTSDADFLYGETYSKVYDLFSQFADKCGVPNILTRKGLAEFYSISRGLLDNIFKLNGYYGHVFYKHFIEEPDIKNSEYLQRILEIIVPDDAKYYLSEKVPYMEK